MNLKTTSKLSKYIAVSSVLGLAANSVNAEIVYTDINPDSVRAGNNLQMDQFYFIDLNGDGINDFELGMQNELTVGPVNVKWNGVWANGINTSSMADTLTSFNGVQLGGSFTYSSVKPLASMISSNSIIGAGQSFSTWGYLGLVSSWSTFSGSSGGAGTQGSFAGAGEKFVGLRFNVNQEIHYGWVRVSVNNDNFGFTLLDFAYENCPDQPIRAGQISGGVGVADTVLLSRCDQIIYNGKTYTQTGMYVDTLSGVSQSGCDSLTPLDLTINNSITINNTTTINEGDSILLAGNMQTTPGTYIDSLVANNGCDSLISTELTVNAIDGVNSLDLTKIQISPNPSNGLFYIGIPSTEKVKYSIFDNLGKMIKSEVVFDKTNFQIDVDKSGIYFLNIQFENTNKVLKLVKE